MPIDRLMASDVLLLMNKTRLQQGFKGIDNLFFKLLPAANGVPVTEVRHTDPYGHAIPKN